MPFLTIAETIAEETKVRAFCSVDGCRHNEDLPLEEIGKKLGFDYPVSDESLVPKLRCSKCGSKKLTISLNIKYQTGIAFDTHGKLIDGRRG